MLEIVLQVDTPSLQTPFIVFSILILSALVIGGFSYMRLSKSFYKQKDDLRTARGELKKAARWQRKYIRMRHLAQKNQGTIRAVKSGMMASKSCLYSIEIETKKIKFGKNIDDVLGLEPGQAKDLNLTSYEAFLSYVHPEDVEQLSSQMEERGPGGPKNFYTYEYRLMLPTGMKRIKASGEVISRGDKPHHTVGFIQDITDMKGETAGEELIVG